MKNEMENDIITFDAACLVAIVIHNMLQHLYEEAR